MVHTTYRRMRQCHRMCPGPLHGELGQRLRQALGEAERAVAGAADTGGVCVALDGLQHLLRPQQRDFLRWIMEYVYLLQM